MNLNEFENRARELGQLQSDEVDTEMLWSNVAPLIQKLSEELHYSY